MTTKCPGCALVLPADPAATQHPYIGSSPECWANYGKLLAREYGDPSYFRAHQLTVDTYAVQHPGVPEQRSIQSVALHLANLCLVLERGADPAAGPHIYKLLAERACFEWLEPPSPIGRITTADVLAAGNAAEHEERVRRWALDVWEAWAAHHATVRRWIYEHLAD